MTGIWYAPKRNNLKYHNQHEPVMQAVAQESASSLLAQTLLSIPGFMPFAKEPKTLDNLAKETSIQKFGAVEKVIRQGEPGNALYIIISGHVQVTIISFTLLGIEIETRLVTTLKTCLSMLFAIQ